MELKKNLPFSILSFETQNGINIASIGKLRDDKTFVVSGSYAYTGMDFIRIFILNHHLVTLIKFSV